MLGYTETKFKVLMFSIYVGQKCGREVFSQLIRDISADFISHTFVLLLIGMFLQTTANKTHKNPKIFIKSVAYQLVFMSDLKRS